jgi:hypothetical protein
MFRIWFKARAQDGQPDPKIQMTRITKSFPARDISAS